MIAVIVYFLLTRIDLIVHGQLYGFGLIFSVEWADSYWVILRSVYACLVALVVLSGMALASGLLEQKQRLSDKSHRVPVKPLSLPKVEEASERAQEFSETALARARDFEDRVRKASEIYMLSDKDQSIPEGNLEVEVEQESESQVAAKSLESKSRAGDRVTSCPRCKRTCRIPLVMLDFDGAKSILVNVCPYCNQTLGSSEDEVDVHCDVNVADGIVKHSDA